MVQLVGPEQVVNSAQDNAKNSLASERAENSSLIDHELVEQVRTRLRHEYELNAKSEHVIYSKIHYEQLMDKQHAQTCWRYLVQARQNADEALRLMLNSLRWRQENQVDTCGPKDLVKEYWLESPFGFTGRTRNGNDVVYLVSKNYKKCEGQEARRQIKQFILCVLFEWERKHQHDMEQFVVVIDTSQSTYRNMDLDFSAWLISLRDHVPARIRACYILGIPMLLRPIIRLIISWMPEQLKQLVHCCKLDELLQASPEPLLELEQVPVEAGGEAPDTWRLAPLEAPWLSEANANQLPREVFDKVRESITFNTSDERIKRLEKMQRDYARQEHDQLKG